MVGIIRSEVIYILSVILPLRKDYVEQKEKEIQFGDGASWKDIEADETTFDKKDVSALVTLDDAAKPIEWEQWLGVVQKGKPETLVLHRLKPPRTCVLLGLEQFAKWSGAHLPSAGFKTGK